ncbi:DUF4440 domain-containing protein [Leifsonia sp. NPDC058230]|uniref:nuclear transport factor 2 family protein n=1 Tax=Leifsonia sp. NPDC058230 TaxID=3346391 RepID=UPI0036D7869F
MKLLDRSDARVAQLLAREPLFHRLPTGSDRAAVDRVAAPEFFEVGASGKRYGRRFVIDIVSSRYANGLEPDDDAWTVDEFEVHELADPIYLATYLLTQADAFSRRSTLWQRKGERWIVLYHQGTRSDLSS